LDFNKRVKKLSVKNFQIVDDIDKVVLQFGRTSENEFVMDFSYPLTPIQAFGICLTSLDRKIGCQ
jgi:tubby-related protein 1